MAHKPMIEIFHAPGTRGIRAIWTCEELGIDYRVVPVDFAADYRATPEWRAMNPVGKVPVMRDGALTLFESGAMVQHLIDRYDNGSGAAALQPDRGTDQHALYLQWSWFAEATFARPLGEIVNHRRAIPRTQQSEVAVEEMRARAWLCVAAVNDALAGRDWLLGERFSGADIMMGYSIMLMETLAPGRLPPDVARYQAAISARECFQRAVAA